MIPVHPVIVGAFVLVFLLGHMRRLAWPDACFGVWILFSQATDGPQATLSRANRRARAYAIKAVRAARRQTGRAEVWSLRAALAQRGCGPQHLRGRTRRELFRLLSGD
jgi:hypothetical protein